MKILSCFILMTLTFKTVYSQNFKGIILSSEDSLGIEGAHVLNISKKTISISSELGYFTINGDVGDTLVVSNINYHTKQFIVNTKDHISIVLKPANIQLEEVIVSNIPTSEADFRKKLIEMPMQGNDKFLPFGMKPAKPRSEIPPLYDRDITGGLRYAIKSNEFKAKVKYYKIKADFDDSIIRSKKYNREIVASITLLEGSELTNFIGYMDLDIPFITKSSEYEIAERILEEFKEYQTNQKVGEN